MMTKAVLFDLDDTLYSFWGLHPKALDAVAETLAREFGFPKERTREENSRLFHLQETLAGAQGGIHSRVVRFQILCEEQGFPLSWAARLDDLYWNVFLREMVPFPGVTEALDALRAQGLRLGVGTNMTARRQLEKLEVLGLLEKVDFVVSSEEAGADKPDPRLFARCAAKAGCEPAECVFVGDNLELDARAAAAFGMRGVWVEPDPVRRASVSDVPSIASVADFPDWLTTHPHPHP